MQLDGFGHEALDRTTYHLSRLGTSDVEFQIGIFLPVSEQKRKLSEKPVVGIAQGRECLRTRVAIQSAFEAFASAYELLPRLEIV